MTRPAPIAIAGALLFALLLGKAALATNSDSCWLEWLARVTGSGSEAAGSDHCATNITVERTIAATYGGTDYGGCLGCWCGWSAGL
jgi:hypothetical protein